MGTNLGLLLEAAGVKGGKAGAGTLTLADGRAMSRSSTDRVVFPKEAMANLPAVFEELQNPELVRSGHEFMEELRKALERMEDCEVNEHTIFGLCQLAHWHRDRPELSPSKKKVFNGWVIPLMLEIKNGRTLTKKPLRQYVLDSISRD